MAIFILIFFGIITILLIVGGSVMLGDENKIGGEMLFASIFTGLVVWLSIDGMDYKDGEPIPVDKNLISVMHDNKVVILRLDDAFTKTYNTKAQYDAILCDKYELMKIISYDMRGEENSEVYELKIDEK